jgi:hypothetical protein
MHWLKALLTVFFTIAALIGGLLVTTLVVAAAFFVACVRRLRGDAPMAANPGAAGAPRAAAAERRARVMKRVEGTDVTVDRAPGALTAEEGAREDRG